MGEINHEDIDMVQTPENVKAVRVRAGLTVSEAAYGVCVPYDLWADAESGIRKLPDKKWRGFILFAGRRAFDYEA